MAKDNNQEGSFKEIKKELDSYASPLEKITISLDEMFKHADKINRAFVAGRVRIQEMDLAVANSASGIIRLGGSLEDVSTTITQIAAGSRRNVIATEEQVSKLYASSKILNTDATLLVDTFAKVGYETSQIGPNIEESIGYIQSIGLNATTVMKDVTANMEQMNRFQFEGGVAGLAKMAAQASMLRFDMKQTFDLANRVLDPEGAIDTAAAFQRLGVSVGNLADPFALMNQSINDPSGLQNSLAEVSKQFTYFDEETKSFKINPQGVLTLREMEKQTGVSAAEMSKMGLAAAELDKRLSEVSLAGLKFENEEDKQYLANISKMGKGGKYEVELKDGTKKELQNLNQEEFNELIEQQKNAPKTVEDIQKSQLGVQKDILSNMQSAAAKVTFGVASSKYVEGNTRGAERIARAVSSSVEGEVPESRVISEKVTGAIDKMRDLFTGKDQGKIDNATFTKNLESIQSDLKAQATSLGPKGMDALRDILVKSNEKIKGDSGIEKEFRKYTSDILTGIGGNTTTKVAGITGTQKSEPLSRSAVFGKGSSAIAQENKTKTTNVNSQVDFGGTITIKVDAPPGVSEQQFKTFFESDEFKRKIYEYYNQKAKELERR